MIRQSGETLLAILNDVLDLSKIEAGKLELEEVEFDIGELAQRAHAAFTAIANKKGLVVRPEGRAAAPGASIAAIPTRMRQILYNLVSNALKFTETGRGEGGDRPQRRRAEHPGPRHRHRHTGRPAGAAVPEVRTGRRLHHPPVWRHRPGPGDLPGIRLAHGRVDRRHQRPGRGRGLRGSAADLPLSGQLRKGRAKAERPAPRSPAPVSAAAPTCGCWRPRTTRSISSSSRRCCVRSASTPTVVDNGEDAVNAWENETGT